MSSDCYHLLEANIWTEITDRKIQPNGYVYAGRKLVNKYGVKLFIKKIE
jgi:hypothetical protein